MSAIGGQLYSKMIKNCFFAFGLRCSQFPSIYISSRFYCEQIERQSSNKHESIFYKRHSLEVLQKKKMMMGLEDPKPREKIEYEEVDVDWNYIERLMSPAKVPEFPKFAKFPSGWQPPIYEKTKNLPYFVRRRRTLELPVYFESRNGMTRHITKVGYIEGDIWALEKDLREHLEKISGVDVPTQVHEVANYIRFRGDYYKETIVWLMDKGF